MEIRFQETLKDDVLDPNFLDFSSSSDAAVEAAQASPSDIRALHLIDSSALYMSHHVEYCALNCRVGKTPWH